MSHGHDAIFTGPLAGYAETLAWDDAPDAIAAAELADPPTFEALIARFQTLHRCIDRHAAISLWSQIYFATLIIPAVALTAARGRALPIDLGTRVSVCATAGVARTFHLEGDDPDTDRLLGPLLDEHVAPVVTILRRHGGLATRLLWENAGWYLVWACGAVAQIRPDREASVRAMLGEAAWPGSHPLAGMAAAARNRLPPARRSCCLRYRIPGFARCQGLCPLASGAVPQHRNSLIPP